MKLAYLPKILSATIFFTFVRDVNFRSRYTLLKGAERLADWEKRFNRLFYYSELKKAWVFKESFRARYRETYRMRAVRITNGFVEEKNNRIKTIKRTAYG